MKTFKLSLALLLLSQLAAAAPSPADRYREAVNLFRQGEYAKAQEAFTALNADHPSYKRTNSYLAQCRERLERDVSTVAFYDQAALEARDILDLRKTLLGHVRTQYPAVTVQDQDGTVSFSFPSRFMFPGEANDPSAAGRAFLGLVKDFALTYRSLYVSVLAERPEGTEEITARRNSRRAVALGAYFFRQGGIPPQNLRIRHRAHDTLGFRIRLQTYPPEADPKEVEIRGATVEVADTVVDPDKDWPLAFDLSLLDPARVRQWSLKILETQRGALVREFKGTSDVWVSLRWDGADDRGRLAPSGEYQAFLTAVTLGGERLEDSSAFVVRPSRTKAPAPPRPAGGPSSRKWAHVIRFSFNQADVAGTGDLEVKQLAQSLKAFPDEAVVIEGFSDATEEDAAPLARVRAERVRSLLIEKHKVPTERLTVRAKEPRRALEGESLQKVVVFFVEPGRPK